MRSSRPDPNRSRTHLQTYADGIGVRFIPSFLTLPLADQGQGNAVEAFEESHHLLCEFTTLFDFNVPYPIQQKPCRLLADDPSDLESHHHSKVGKLRFAHLAPDALIGNGSWTLCLRGSYVMSSTVPPQSTHFLP